jgi:hypothetical protein
MAVHTQRESRKPDVSNLLIEHDGWVTQRRKYPRKLNWGLTLPLFVITLGDILVDLNNSNKPSGASVDGGRGGRYL